MIKPKLIFLVTEDRYFLSHRLPMARAAQQAGFAVTLITRVTAHRAAIEAAGVRVLHLSLDRQSLNPFKAFYILLKLTHLYWLERPQMVHHIAMKPVLLGALAAWLARVPVVINAFAGLGYLFTAQNARARLLRFAVLPVFRVLLRRRNSFTLLQNADDKKTLLACHLIDRTRSEIIPGSGVELSAFAPTPPPPSPPFVVVFAGRMIGIKGLATLRRAFELLDTEAPYIRLLLCGGPDPANPGSWRASELEAWAANAPNVEYRGHCDDMAAVWRTSHLAVQPSWGGEGIPKSLLEAAASGRVIVATDVPGCREMVTPGGNGLLVPPRDAVALANAIRELAADPDQCRAMGEASRALLLTNGLDADAVTARTVAFYQTCVIRCNKPVV